MSSFYEKPEMDIAYLDGVAQMIQISPTGGNEDGEDWSSQSEEGLSL